MMTLGSPAHEKARQCCVLKQVNSSDFFFFSPKSLHTHLRKMRLSQKTAYQMFQTMNMPGNFWSTHQPKDFGCHCGKKSESCSVSVEEFQVTPSIHTSYRPLFTNEFTFNSFSHRVVKVRA
ncbi:unnamed protein product [Rangifer tarandus platyrhynchus]|uniref:Uncharacterized protein n=2 Tax=Rangifer tarandus platyrhynchus TaxID=3082113 RepID=A0ABN8YFR7_RANTA|nr:unnamed protein product [Rangifer tarandus platyrhynchus]